MGVACRRQVPGTGDNWIRGRRSAVDGKRIERLRRSWIVDRERTQ